MTDSAIVASIVAGEPEGLAAAYDKYAGDLYGYCRSLLREPDDAADAVQDTFVIAASKLEGLRDRERLRAWLFAVARNECLHRLNSRRASSSLQDAPELADESADVGVAAERAETVALLRAAVGGLNVNERDVINQLWHGLEVAEVATVLGVSRNYAYTLFSRARDQLEASVGVLLVGRTGRRDCATLDALLGDWDGRLTALLRKRVARHIDRCPVCSERRRREFTPALLYGLTPAAVLGVAALRGGTALTGTRQLTGPLAETRAHLLQATSDPAAHAATIGTAGGRSTQSFGGGGFPEPSHFGHLGVLRRSHLPLAAGVTAVAAAAAAAVFFALPHPGSPGLPGGGMTGGEPLPGGAPTAPTNSAGGSAAPPRAVGGPTGSPTGGATGGVPTGGGPTRVISTRSPKTSPSGTPGASTSAAPIPSTAPSSTSPTTPAGGPTTTTAAPTTAPPPAGSLLVSPTTVLLSPLLGGSLTLTASGGPVSWSISEPFSLLGKLTVSPSAGTLSAGSSVTVTINVSGLASLDSQLTVSPGGQLVTVVLGLG
ncbi:MAG TPA: sigma-70 family RNA polymerase sigma factor [Trebonia sp.]|nr:sigma-70 family RNA polymerase sigma factor [Trebonia sp.]